MIIEVVKLDVENGVVHVKDQPVHVDKLKRHVGIHYPSRTSKASLRTPQIIDAFPLILHPAHLLVYNQIINMNFSTQRR